MSGPTAADTGMALAFGASVLALVAIWLAVMVWRYPVESLAVVAWAGVFALWAQRRKAAMEGME